MPVESRHRRPRRLRAPEPGRARTPRHRGPTPERIRAALELLEVDAQAFEDVRIRWAGRISVVIDRIRPVLAVLGIHADGLEPASDTERLTQWLTSNLPQWPASDVLSAARRSRDDRAMGEAAWRTLGDIAQLPAWNDALASYSALFERLDGLAAPRGPRASSRRY